MRRHRVALALAASAWGVSAASAHDGSVVGAASRPAVFASLPDGTVVPGYIMQSDVFSGTSLPADLLPVDEWPGPINLVVVPELGCVRHENVTVGGDALNLNFTSNARSSCPQEWLNTPFYQANRTSWPVGQPTSYDASMVYQQNFQFTYGQVYMRARMPSGTGPGLQAFLSGTACQSTPYDALGNFIDDLDAKSGLTTCNWPTDGSQEFDMPQYFPSRGGANGQFFASLYVDCSSPGSPPLQGTFFGVNYCGSFYTSDGSGGLPFINSIAGLSDPRLNFHTYMVDWRPGSWSFYIDGVLMAQTLARWVPKDSQFWGAWVMDQLTVDAATLPTSASISWLTFVCPPGVPCVVNHGA